MADIWLIRHGQAGDLMGEYDLLSELGWAQSRRAGERWRHLGPVHHVITGAMRRHKETEIAFRETFGPMPAPTVDAAWNEFDHKAVIRAARAADLQLDGSGRAAALGLFVRAMERWACGEHDADYPEPYLAFQGRVIAGLERAAARLGRGETALVFTSGGAISAVCRHLMEAPPRAAFRLNTSLLNTSFTRIRVTGDLLNLASVNVHSHFDDAPELIEPKRRRAR